MADGEGMYMRRPAPTSASNPDVARVCAGYRTATDHAMERVEHAVARFAMRQAR